MPNAALLAFNASAIVNHDHDPQKVDLAQNDAVPNAQGATHSSKLHVLRCHYRIPSYRYQAPFKQTTSLFLLRL